MVPRMSSSLSLRISCNDRGQSHKLRLMPRHAVGSCGKIMENLSSRRVAY